MPRKWVPGDPFYGEYQTVLFDERFSAAELLLDTDGEQLQDTDGNDLRDTGK